MCARCSKTVVDLSGMTEAEVLAHAQPGTCVRLPTDAEGRVRFAAPVVPLSRLRSRPAPAIAVAALAMTVACTPHVRPEVEPEPAPPPVVVTAAPTPTAVAEPLVIEVPRNPDRGHMMGAVMGKPVYKSRPVHYRGPYRGGVLCDTLEEHPLGAPANTDEGWGLLPAKELAKADLLARCDP